MTDPDFDTDEAHRFFSADCFNRAWELIAKANRTSDENEEMIRLTHASLWHWHQRPDCTDVNRSIGYWQASRIHAMTGRADEARHYGQQCLAVTPPDSPFLLAYAHEALARAEHVAGNHTMAMRHRLAAAELAERFVDAGDRESLLKDLETLATQPGDHS